MLVIKIELWSAVTGIKSEIGRMYIANKGGTTSRGDYAVAVCRKGDTAVPKEIYGGLAAPHNLSQAARSGEVLNYPRISYNVWRLVSRALRAAFPEEK